MFRQQKRGEYDPQPCADLSKVKNYDTGNCVYCDAFDNLEKFYPIDKSLTRKENCLNILATIEKTFLRQASGLYVPTISVIPVGKKAGLKTQQDRLNYFTVRDITTDTLENANLFLVSRWKKIHNFLADTASFTFAGQTFNPELAKKQEFINLISNYINDMKLGTVFSIDVKHNDGSVSRLEFTVRTLKDIDNDAKLVTDELKRLEQLLKPNVQAPEPPKQGFAFTMPAPQAPAPEPPKQGFGFSRPAPQPPAPKPEPFVFEEPKDVVYRIGGFTIVVNEDSKKFIVRTKDDQFQKTFDFGQIYAPTKETPYFIAINGNSVLYVGPSMDTRNDYFVIYYFDVDQPVTGVTLSKGEFAPLGPILKTKDNIYFLTRARTVPFLTLAGKTMKLNELMDLTDPKKDTSTMFKKQIVSFYDARSNRHLY